MSHNMSQISEISKALVSGISSVEYLLTEGINSFPDIQSLGVSEMEIDLKSGYSWQDIPILDDSGTYDDNEVPGPNGIAYEKSLIAFLPHADQTNRNTLHGLRYADLIVRFRDRSGNRHLLGTPDEPITVVVSFRVQQVGNSMGYPITFSGTHTHPTLFLTRPELPQFYINANGQLIYLGDLPESFAINSDGEIEVTGAQEDQYSLDSRGRIAFT